MWLQKCVMFAVSHQSNHFLIIGKRELHMAQEIKVHPVCFPSFLIGIYAM